MGDMDKGDPIGAAIGSRNLTEFRAALAYDFFLVQKERHALIGSRIRWGALMHAPLYGAVINAVTHWANNPSQYEQYMLTGSLYLGGALMCILSSYCIYVSGYRLFQQYTLPRPEKWWGKNELDHDGAKRQLLALLARIAAENYFINDEREQWFRSAAIAFLFSLILLGLGYGAELLFQR